MVRGLAPVGLVGLDDALETLALSVRHLFRKAVTFQCDRPVLQPNPKAAAHLVRIAQEAVNNAITHGKPDRIEISLSSMDGKGVVTVRDNGVGIPDAACNAGGIGLHTMAYRARSIGASLEVRRRTRRGTLVTCAFPLSETLDTRDKPDHERSNG